MRVVLIYSLVVRFLAIKIHAAAVCRDGAVNVGGQCLRFSTDRLSWNDAKLACSSQNGQLASLNDPRAVLAYTEKNYHKVEFWTGGSDITTEGVWKWITGEPLRRFPWSGPACNYDQQPDNRGGNQDCLVVNWSCGGYDDQTCSGSQRYICEDEPQPQPKQQPPQTRHQQTRSTSARQPPNTARQPPSTNARQPTNTARQPHSTNARHSTNTARQPHSTNARHTPNTPLQPPPIRLADCTGLWFPLGNQCFRVISELLTWRSARENCNPEIADLAQPNDITTLNDYLKENDDARKNYWLGASDLATESEWLWLDGSILSNQDPRWGSANPDDGGSLSSQDCLSMRPGHSARMLDDDRCDALLYSICQRPIF